MFTNSSRTCLKESEMRYEDVSLGLQSNLLCRSLGINKNHIYLCALNIIEEESQSNDCFFRLRSAQTSEFPNRLINWRPIGGEWRKYCFDCLHLLEETEYRSSWDEVNIAFERSPLVQLIEPKSTKLFSVSSKNVSKGFESLPSKVQTIECNTYIVGAFPAIDQRLKHQETYFKCINSYFTPFILHNLH